MDDVLLHTPLLTEAAAERAHRALHHLAQTPERTHTPLRGVPAEPTGTTAASLASGAAGLALLHAERARTSTGAAQSLHRERATATLTDALAALAEQPLSPWLFTGLAGPLWAWQRVRACFPECAPEVAETDLRHMDDLLRQCVQAAPQAGPDTHELVAGVTGLGVYALERERNGGGRALLDAVLACLRASAIRSAPGLAWCTLMAGAPREDWGLAHGVPGVMAFLARAARVAPEAQALLEPALDRLLALPAADPTAHIDWPCWTAGDGASARTPRLGWCYGAPGAVAALYAAGTRLARPALCTQAAALMSRAWARRALAFDGGSGLCHGRAGLLHVLTRLHAARPEPQWQQAAASLVVQLVDDIERARWEAEGGFLTGPAGIELALRAALDPRGAWWDACLLLDFGGAESL